MRVLGISGLHHSVDVKRRELPGLPDRAYRIAQGFDAAAALVCDGEIVAAAAEERFTGAKATGAFPVRAIDYCLRAAGLTMADVDRVAHGFAYDGTEGPDTDYQRRWLAEAARPEATVAHLDAHWPGQPWAQKFRPVPHHLAHAASAHHTSGWAESLVLVADGMGERDSLTVLHARGSDLRVLRRIPALHSLGTLYAAVTLYLGFEFNMDEYKVMGLAPYGDAGRYFADMGRLVRLLPDGAVTVPALAANRTTAEQETHAGTLAGLTALFGPAREPGSALEQRHMDLAAALQATLESALLHVLRHFADTTGVPRLAMAGGVALNCSANGVIARSGLFDDVFVQPAAGDDGSALGAALYASAHVPATRMRMPYWGPGFTDAELTRAIDKATPATGGWTTRRLGTDALVEQTAELLAAGEVAAWFQGRMEFGPRALGNRSILADPRGPDMREHLNAIVKERENFRPFAPVVPWEDAGTYFEIGDDERERFAHMLFVTRTREAYRGVLSSVTHVDGTARVQVVRRTDNERLWLLCRAFGARTGLPVLLNTSFNLRGQPIVRDPDTAVATFGRSRLDHLVLGDHLVSKVAAPAIVKETADATR